MTLVQEKKGGPYTKNEKMKRQHEVFRLHFEHGYSAVNISGMMKVNRNTINSDISYWYSILSKEWESYDVESWCMKQMHRLESQRARLLKELEKNETISEKLAIERILLDIDTKMMNFVSKLILTKKVVRDKAARKINNWAKKKGIRLRVIDSDEFFSVSKEAAKKIGKMIDEDHKKIIGRM